MKRLLLAVLCIVGFSSARPIWVCDNAAGQSGHKYRGVCVINDSLAWVVGEAGQVWKRTGGTYSNSWIHIDTLPNEYQFNDVFFINENTGWIVGAGTQDTLKYRGIIYKTTNGGDDWDDQTPALASDPYPTPFLKVQFIDGDVGYITCGNGRVIKTENGGFTWTRTSSDP